MNRDNLLEPYINRVIILLISILYLLWVFKSYTGNQHSNSLQIFKYTLGEFSYQNDLGIQNSLFFKTSILFQLIKTFKINLDNDLVGFSIHLILSSISGFFLFLILKKFLQIKSTKDILIFLIILMSVNDFFISGTYGKSSWISNTTFNISYFGQNLRFVFIYFLLAQNILVLTLLTPLILLISFKPTFMVVACGILYSLIFYKKNKIYWIMSPILTFVYFLSLSNNYDLSFHDKIYTIQVMLDWDGPEAAFHLQPKLKIIKLIISFMIMPFLFFYLKKNIFINFAKVVYFVSLSNFIISYFYLKYFYIYFPVPQFVMLGPPRLMELYQCFFWLVLVYFIFQLKISNTKKTFFFISIFYLFFEIKGFIISLISALFALHIKEKKQNNFRFNKNILFLFFLLIIAPTIAYLSFQRFDKNFNLESFKEIRKWTLGYNNISKNKIKLALKVKNCEDFILIPLIENIKTKKLQPDFFFLSISGKSRFVPHPVLNNLNLEYINEIEKRKKLMSNFFQKVHSGQTISSNLADNLKKYDLVFIVEDKYLPLFPSKITKYNIQGENFMLLMKEQKELEFHQQCIKILI